MPSKLQKHLPRIRLLLLLCIATSFWHCEKKQAPTDWLARIGDRYVTVNEFLIRAELSPPPAFRHVNGYADTRGLLELLIGEKLLANEAEALGLHRDAAFQNWQRYTESVAIGKELYREEVQNKVEVRESEIDSALALAQKTWRITFFKSMRREDAERFLKIAAGKKSFELAMQDYFGAVVSPETYTSRFTFGDGDEKLENAVFSLPPGQTSGVVETSKGFFVVHLIEVQANGAASKSDDLDQRAAVRKILRARKADKRSARFVEIIMRAKKVVLKGKTFSILTKFLDQRIDFGRKTSVETMRPLEEIDYRRAESDLSDHLDEPLITFSEGEWTVREILEKLRLRNLPFNHESPVAMRRALETDLQTLARDEFLAQEGYRRNLQKRNSVREEVQMWVDHHLYTMMVARLGLQPQSGDEIIFPGAVDSLKKKYSVVVADEKLKTIELTGIPMIAVHPGRPDQIAVPLWPLF